MSAKYSPLDWYEAPLYYDLAFADRTSRESDFLEEMMRCYVGRGRRILEPACGSGRLLASLAARGYRVDGFDAAAAMVDFSRRRLARTPSRVWQARMESFATRGRYHLAHCLVSTFKYLLTEAHARAHLEQIASALVSGGIYVLGFHLTDYSQTRCERERWTGAGHGLEVVCNIAGWPPCRRRRRERLRSRLVVRRADAKTERYETSWEFRTYDARQFRRLLASVPTLEHVATYDFDYDASREVVFGDGQLDHVVILRRR